ncbi:MAG: NAD(P)(+) transhydrogenase (Re/Si-specific) subunit beta, partial [Clostridia bacterium]|nr:NAD(P)(+) transhydrogenase (Re/Si-specific) subunit beta [Clostridia bacterium]
MKTHLSPAVFYIISGVLVLGVLAGLSLMSKPKTARAGNAVSAISAIIAIIVTMYNYDILTAPVILTSIAAGVIISLFIVFKVKMIQMPQLVALLNGFGGMSSALVAVLSYKQAEDGFSLYTAEIALIIGSLTFTG